MVAMFTFRIDHYRWYDSDGGEAASTQLAAQDTLYDLSISGDKSLQLRFLLQETGGADGSSMDDYQLEYSKNGGTSTTVPTSDGGAGISAGTAGLTNNNATTNRGTDGLTDGTGSFIAGEQSTDGLIDDHLLTSGNFTEHVYGITIYDANVADGDQFTFTITGPNKATDAVTATLDISKAGTDVLLADDVQSTSELTSPAVGQEHALLADDVQSTSELTSPAIGQKHVLLADDVESASELTTPNYGHAILADDVESASEVTAPAIGQDHQLLADDVQSTSELTAPAIGQKHALTATSVESASELTAPAASEVNILLADDVESASELTSPAIGQVHGLLADDATSASELTAPALGQEHALTATSVESASSLTSPALTSSEPASSNSGVSRLHHSRRRKRRSGEKPVASPDNPVQSDIERWQSFRDTYLDRSDLPVVADHVQAGTTSETGREGDSPGVEPEPLDKEDAGATPTKERSRSLPASDIIGAVALRGGIVDPTVGIEAARSIDREQEMARAILDDDEEAIVAILLAADI